MRMSCFPFPLGISKIDERIPARAVHGSLMDAGAVEDKLWEKLRPWAENRSTTT
jgi:hypothetical protein